MVYPDYEGLVADYNSQPILVSEVTGSYSSSIEFTEEPEIFEPETEPPATPLQIVMVTDFCVTHILCICMVNLHLILDCLW